MDRRSTTGGPDLGIHVGPDGAVYIGGFKVVQVGDRLSATAVNPLTQDESDWGCCSNLVAGTSREMLVLVSAELIKQDMVRRARDTSADSGGSAGG